MRRSLFLTTLFSLTLVGCTVSGDRDEGPSWGGGAGEGPADDGADPGDDGDAPDPGDDGGATPDVGDDGDSGDDGGDTEEPPPDDTGGGGSDTGAGDTGDTGGGESDTGEPGDTGGPGPAEDDPPDCSPYWALWPTDASAEPPVTRDELWCYVNRKRMSYISHGRSNGPDDDAGDGSVTWPYTFGWDKDLVDSAQAEAERVAAGGAPAGTLVNGFGAKSLWISGNNTADYMLTTVDDHVTDWWDPTPCCHDPTTSSGISTGNGGARMGLYYHDYSGAGPVLTTMGAGMVEDAGGVRILVVRLAP